MKLDSVLKQFEPKTLIQINGEESLMTIEKFMKHRDYVMFKDRAMTHKIIVGKLYNHRTGIERPYIHITIR